MKYLGIIPIYPHWANHKSKKGDYPSSIHPSPQGHLVLKSGPGPPPPWKKFLHRLHFYLPKSMTVTIGPIGPAPGPATPF